MAEPGRGIDRWERYCQAAEGFTEYWYPAMASPKLGSKPQAVRIAGRDMVMVRSGGRAYALEDVCPHRRIPLSEGRCEFEHTISCVYHGWTFDLRSGALVAALTDGPDSPIVGKVSVRRFPVEERAGLVWVWTGDGEPVPVEDDIPEELLRADAIIVPLLRKVEGNWRYATENGFDESHGKFLHRTAWWVFFKRMSGWNVTEIVRSPDGKWLTRAQMEVHADDDYPGLGRWPRFNLFQRRAKSVAQGSNKHPVSVRLPGTLRVVQPDSADWTHYEWYVPATRNTYRYLVLAVTWGGALKRALFHLRYWTYILWVHHYGFNNQDLRVVKLMPDTHPERLFRPDVSITAWRRMCEEEARRLPPKTTGTIPAAAE
ncbi:MAG: Rieske 2Fe-2S domain-containing protein [Alphaproteobacteria bacterium]|nr:Rieske 2Fe-2S domain-containing protein [Alphaproteobacteria bacterium]